MKFQPLESIPSFFATRLTRQVRELWASTLILDLALSMVTIFEPVFIYVVLSKIFTAQACLQYIALFYLLVYVPYLFLVPLGAKFAKRFGYEISIAVSSLFLISFYFSLFIANRSIGFLLLAALSYILQKTFYWPAFHSNFARFGAEGEQGREIGNLWALQSLIYIIGPFIGGLVLNFFGFRVLFIIVSILVLASNLPMLITKEYFESAKFSYAGAWKRLFSRDNRRHLLAQLGYGEEWIALVIWPIFMYLVAKDFLGLGVISALSTLIATVVVILLGRLTDKKGEKQNVLRLGAIFYFFSWLLKLISRSQLGITLLDTYSRVAKNAIALPVTASVYHDAHDSSVMATIVFFEMSLVLGKILAIAACLAVLLVFSPGFNAMFVLGGLFTLFYLLFKLK